LAAIENGGKGISCSNQHYGVPRNILQPGTRLVLLLLLLL
jgi:allantoicase